MKEGGGGGGGGRLTEGRTFIIIHVSVNRRAALTYNKGEVVLTSDHGKNIELRPGNGGQVLIKGPAVWTSPRASCDSKRAGSIRFYGGKL